MNFLMYCWSSFQFSLSPQPSNRCFSIAPIVNSFLSHVLQLNMPSVLIFMSLFPTSHLGVMRCFPVHTPTLGTALRYITKFLVASVVIVHYLEGLRQPYITATKTLCSKLSVLFYDIWQSSESYVFWFVFIAE